MSLPLTAAENRRIGRAMHDYQMLDNGDRVLVAVSGGVDSLFLARLLHWWRKKAPVQYTLQIIHLDMQPHGDLPGEVAEKVVEELANTGLSCLVIPANLPSPVSEESAGASTKDVCFKCARSRRSQLFAHAHEHSFTTLALGHHCDDIVETFFLNLTCAGNISTMRPRQNLFKGRLALIRPLAYLRKKEIIGIARRVGLQPVSSACPLSGKTRRQDIRDILDDIYARIPGSREHIFAALGNIRADYLLNPQVSNRK